MGLKFFFLLLSEHLDKEEVSEMVDYIQLLDELREYQKMFSPFGIICLRMNCF